MRTSSALLAALALTAPAAVVAGCGDDAPGASQPPAEVGMRNLRFDPDRITVTRGQRIVWTNNESIQHNVVAEEGADFKSDLLDQGKTFEVTAEDAGTIAYHCTLHPGMEGTIDVTG